MDATKGRGWVDVVDWGGWRVSHAIYNGLMEWNPEAFAERDRYRPVSIALALASHLALAGVFIGAPDWICFLVSESLLIVLTVITYHRLRNAALSGAWIFLMIQHFGIGPTWHLSDHLAVNLVGSILSCVPVILGWFVPAKFGANPKSESA